jgi:tetratricopeptide (TPR) repeat protein
MPSKPLDRATIREIVDLLTQFCATPTQRRALLTMAFGVHPLLNVLNYEDDTLTFLPNAISQLYAYGKIDEENTALWLILAEARKRVGPDDLKRIDALEPVVNGVVKFPVATIAPSHVANYQDEIAQLLTQLEVAEAKEAWDIVIEYGEKLLALEKSHESARAKTARAYNRHGLIFDSLRDYDRAIEDYNHAINLNSRQGTYFFNRGLSYCQKRDYEDAIADFDRAIQLKPSDAEYYVQRGVCYHHKRDYERAIADFDRAIQLEPQNPDYYWERGKSYHNQCFYLRKGKFDCAIADFDRCIRLVPENAAYYFSRGLSYKLKGDHRAARVDFQRAADIGHEQAKEELSKL